MLKKLAGTLTHKPRIVVKVDSRTNTWMRRILLAMMAGMAPLGMAQAAGYALYVQPVLSEEDTRRAFMPLCQFITQVANQPCQVHTSPNFLAYWDTIRRGEKADFVLDAAHFTDYRAVKQGYKVLVKVPDTVSYSLVVPEDKIVFDPVELAGKPVASLGQPSIGAARLNALFPNPMRQPAIVEVNNAVDGVALVREGKVDGAILPTPVVSQAMARGGGLVVVTTTEPLPHIALSASPRVDAEMRERLRAALLKANTTPEGQRMLRSIGFPRFESATEEMYANHGRVLKEYWGY
jgi:hypothetical protein